MVSLSDVIRVTATNFLRVALLVLPNKAGLLDCGHNLLAQVTAETVSSKIERERPAKDLPCEPVVSRR
jgi:hypothetical protein